STQAQKREREATLALNEQVINEVVRGSLYLRAARIESGTNRMRDVTIYDLSDPSSRRSILADSGQLAFAANERDLVLTLYHGQSVESVSEAPQRLQRSFFTEDRIIVRGVAAGLDRGGGAAAAYRSDREYTICELNARVKAGREPRDIAWRRLRLAQNPADSLATPPRERWPLADWYCGLQAAWRGFGSVKEAQAAVTGTNVVVAALPAAPVAVPTARVLATARQDAPQAAPAYDEVLMEGLRFEYTAAQSQIDRYRVEIEKKFSIAAACVVFVLLGAPIALRFPRGGVGLTIGVSLGIFAIYYVGLLVGESLSDRGIVDPAIAMWGANVLLGIVGIYLTARLGSEGSTHRGSEASEWWGRLFEGIREKLSSRRSA
ncbi:MAG TPA: LptF/LptG family permease, partial [Gemmatimonadaceae bacterium]|nr:LptF/LptG family permease [Gemmatimonadaceae bacterium]